jgi:hypothetical protein
MVEKITPKPHFLTDLVMIGVQLTKEPFDGKATLYDVAYTVTASIKNTGSVYGCEVAQLVCPRAADV